MLKIWIYPNKIRKAEYTGVISFWNFKNKTELFEISGNKIKIIPNWTPKIQLHAVWPDVAELSTKEAWSSMSCMGMNVLNDFPSSISPIPCWAPCGVEVLCNTKLQRHQLSKF